MKAKQHDKLKACCQLQTKTFLLLSLLWIVGCSAATGVANLELFGAENSNDQRLVQLECRLHMFNIYSVVRGQCAIS